MSSRQEDERALMKNGLRNDILRRWTQVRETAVTTVRRACRTHRPAVVDEVHVQGESKPRRNQTLDEIVRCLDVNTSRNNAKTRQNSPAMTVDGKNASPQRV